MTTACFCAFIALVWSFKLYSQCSITPWMTPTVITSDASFGSFAFTNVNDASSSNNQYAEAASTLSLFSGDTHYLKATGLGFAIPAAATIFGIEVDIERSADNIGLFTSVEDASVRLVKNNTPTGSNHASGTNWPSSDANATYEGAADGWSASLTTTDINTNDFGVAISARINGLVSLWPVARIDQVRMRVHYLVTLPLHEFDFKVTTKEGAVWIQAAIVATDAAASAIITLERSTDQQYWRNIHQFLPGEKMEWRDVTIISGDYYYRFKQADADHSVTYSKVKHINVLPFTGVIIQSPFTNELILRSAEGFSSLQLFTTSGCVVYARIFGVPVYAFSIPTTHLSSGPYLLKAGDTVFKVMKKY